MKRALILVLLACLFGVPGQSTAQHTSKAKLDPRVIEQLKTLQAKQQAARVVYLKKPRDANAKKGYVDATMVLADKTLTCPALKSTEKYPQALRLYRETLKVAPGNPVATKWVRQIEDIYRSLGRPIPK